MGRMKGDRRLQVVLVLAALFGAGAFLVLRHKETPPAPVARPTTQTAQAVEAAASVPRADDRADARRSRDAMRTDILAALRRRDAGPPVTASPPPRPAGAPAPAASQEPAPGRYDPEYIREVFHQDMFPFLRGCYDAALRRQPKLAGRLVLSFSIVGDPQVGGIVEDADFAEDSDLKDPEMETCVRESLMTITFDKPPSGGGYVKVKYPVLFSPGEDEPDGGSGGP